MDQLRRALRSRDLKGARSATPGHYALEIATVGALLLLLGLVIYGDHVLQGSLVSDDWAIADGYRHLPDAGYWTMVDSLRAAQGSRPILTLLLPLPHAAFGVDADGHLATAVVLGAATSLCFFAVLRSLGLERLHAAAIAALVYVFPWADAIRLWGNPGINNVAVCLYLLGLLVALRGLRTSGSRAILIHLGALALYVASILTYESASVAALLTGPLYAHRGGWKAALRRWPVDVVTVGAAIAWSAAHTSKNTGSLRAQLGHLPEMARDGASLVVQATWPLGGRPLVLGAGVLLVVSVAVAQAISLPVEDPFRDGLRRWLFMAAAAAVGVGAAYAALVPTAYATALKPGLENRFNLLAALPIVVLAYSVAMVAATLVGRLLHVRKWGLGLVSVVAVGTLAVGYVARTELDERRWDRAASFTSQVLDAVRANDRPPSGTTIYTFGHPAQTGPGVPVFFDTWDLNGAVRVVWGDRTLRGYPVYSGARFACRRHAIRPIILPTPQGRLDPPSAVTDSGSGPYWGPDRGTRYGRVLFVDVPTGRSELIRDQAQCESAIRRYRPGPFEP